MTETVLFHHAQGLTRGVEAFADRLRASGHTVHLPDLYDGRVFTTLDEGLAYRDQIGMATLTERAAAAAADLPTGAVFAGFSLGAAFAQELAAATPGSRGALLIHGAVPVKWMDVPWRAGLPVQIHISEDDPFEDRDDMESLVTDVGAELFLYPGDLHLFTDSSLDSYAPDNTEMVIQRSLAFLERASG